MLIEPLRRFYLTLRSAGIDRRIADSNWRRNRLLILCWHGISLDDEHLWRPGLYITAAQFRSRLALLRENNYNVLPLSEALDRLWTGTLPPRSVAITFDDGAYDFHALAAPVLAESGYPATLYLTTYYVDYQRPVFSPMLAYLLWKAPPHKREAALAAGIRIEEETQRDQLSGSDKDALLTSLARELDIDYEKILSRRILQLMNQDEVRQLSDAGNITMENHTHRHRTPVEPALVLRELRDNNARIEEITGRRPSHFCYPSGVFRKEYFPLLEQEHLRSATTCEAGLASRDDNHYLIPRLLDHSFLPEWKYLAWLSGFHALLPG